MYVKKKNTALSSQSNSARHAYAKVDQWLGWCFTELGSARGGGFARRKKKEEARGTWAAAEDLYAWLIEMGGCVCVT